MNRSRRRAAMRSFSFRIFPSSSNWLILLYLEIGELQLIAANELRTFPAAGRTMEIVPRNRELRLTGGTLMPPGADFDLQFEVCQVGISGERFETKPQSLGINSGK